MSEFNGPLMGVKEQTLILLHKATKALSLNPPHVDTAKKCIYGVIVLMEKNEVIDPDFEWLQQKQKEQTANQTAQNSVTDQLNLPNRTATKKTNEDLLKEFGW